MNSQLVAAVSIHSKRVAPRLLDGGIGSWGRFRGGRLLPDPLGDPTIVPALHRAYRSVGVDALRTATFALPSALAEGLPPISAARVLAQALAWARAAPPPRAEPVPAQGAAHPRPLVLLSLGPTGAPTKLPAEAAARPYSLLARVLANGSAGVTSEDVATPAAVDAVVLETFRSLHEIECALDGLAGGGYAGPCWVLVSPAESHRLRDAPLGAAATRLAARGVAVLGVGCTTPDVSLPAAVVAIRESYAGPLALSPAAHDDGPEWTAATADLARSAGVDWVGGCCGVGPMHVASLRLALNADAKP